MIDSIRSLRILLSTLLGLSLPLLGSARSGHAQNSPLGDFISEPATEVSTFGVRHPPRDPRFFGKFCLATPREFCKSIPVIPDPCVTVSSVRTRLDYFEFQAGSAVSGQGEVVIDGKRTVFVLAGAVASTGRLKAVTVAHEIGEQRGELQLSSDGLALTTSIRNRTITLRKDACGNNPPQVTLSAVSGPTFTFGQSVMLASQITDEDAEFPVERVVFSSDRQGMLAGWRPAARTLVTTVLQPGPHVITVAVTDSGGLTARATTALTVVNRPPNPPAIFLPVEGASLIAGGSALLKGSATDPDTGALPGSALSWSAQLTPSAPFTPLGTGRELPAVFTAPNPALRLRLTARDSGGAEVSTERVVRVLPNSGNTPPVPLITSPDRNQFTGTIQGSAFAGTPASYVATVWDQESAPPDLQIRWTFTLLRADGNPDTAPPAPNPAPIAGTLAPSVVYPAVGARVYRVTLTVTDPGGLSASDSVEILVTSSVIL
jgi:hypothetical protein